MKDMYHRYHQTLGYSARRLQELDSAPLRTWTRTQTWIQLGTRTRIPRQGKNQGDYLVHMRFDVTNNIEL